ncbi:MAG: endonuclease/exonuclease/phosphatase family protein [Paracoccaceae bacterium]|uniref:endonuclease/exonuclease/phosphatase family protein n=1 Tax=Seohaeicola saemankumensis TaxID=481181 RepID=UPI001E3B10FD|nr:endonuclease/exonuclease/phosphatase family protein [Seohaeicola saemankumensis]MCD1627119.1 endonuclease/exonuclease/phosphatase family protein [Seohaeicola saemankumensis]
MTITPPSKLTICTWNCNGALRHKLGQIDSLDADILIIQECEDPAQSQDAAYRTWAGENYAWIGTTASKGLGIFPRRNLAIEPLRWTHEARFFLPRAVAGVPVCAVWAHRATRKGRNYIGQISQALDSRAQWLNDPACIFAGDFNSSAVWDGPRKSWGHTPTMQRLAALGLQSAYHRHYNVAHGDELHPSFFLQRNLAKPYHLDYILTGKAWQIGALRIGAPAEWLACSDHMPLMAELVRPG